MVSEHGYGQPLLELAIINVEQSLSYFDVNFDFSFVKLELPGLAMDESFTSITDIFNNFVARVAVAVAVVLNYFNGILTVELELELTANVSVM